MQNIKYNDDGLIFIVANILMNKDYYKNNNINNPIINLVHQFNYLHEMIQYYGSHKNFFNIIRNTLINNNINVCKQNNTFILLFL